MWTRRSISVLPLSLTGALRGSWRSYQITQHSSNVLHISTLTRHASTLPTPTPCPHLHGHTNLFSRCRRLQVRRCWIQKMDLPLSELITTNMAIMNYFTLLKRGKVVEEQEKKWRSICNKRGVGKDHIPICPRHMFSVAQIFSLFGAFGKSRLLTREPNVQMYTFMHWFSCIALTLRAAHVLVGGSPWGVIITKGSTNDFIKDATPSCVLHSTPSEVPRQD